MTVSAQNNSQHKNEKKNNKPHNKATLTQSVAPTTRTASASTTNKISTRTASQHPQQTKLGRAHANNCEQTFFPK